jgi:hypothetical protein
MSEEAKHEPKGTVAPKFSPVLVWQIATIAVIVVLAVSVVTKGFSFTGATGGELTSQQAATKALTYINNLLEGQATATLVGVNESNGLYNINLDIGGQQYNSYMTKDGSMLFPSAYQLPATVNSAVTNSSTASSATGSSYPKSDTPTAELYIFSYCPAGTAALSSFAQAAKAMNDSTADFRVKFFSNMHGDHEKQQNMIQECIQSMAKSKYWDYAIQYTQNIYPLCGPSGDAECDKNESIKLMNSLGINSTAVISCVADNGTQFYQSDQNDAGILQLQYSPSVVINGVYIGNADRSPEGLKNLICNAFTTPPAMCNQTLSTSASQATGGCG